MSTSTITSSLNIRTLPPLHPLPSSKVLFHLHEHSSRYALKQEIDKAVYTRGSTNTADALRKIRTEVFREDRGDRQMKGENKFANVAILLTDGSSDSFSEVSVKREVVIHDYLERPISWTPSVTDQSNRPLRSVMNVSYITMACARGDPE